MSSPRGCTSTAVGSLLNGKLIGGAPLLPEAPEDVRVPPDAAPLTAPPSSLTVLHDALVNAVKLDSISVKDSCVYVSGRVNNAVLYVKAKLSALEDITALKAIKPYAVKANAGMTIFYEKAGELLVQAHCDTVAAKTLDKCSSVQKAIVDYISYASLKVSSASDVLHLRLARVWGPCVECVNDRSACASGKVQNMIVHVKAQGNFAKEQAFASYVRMIAALGNLGQPMLEKLAARYGAVKLNIVDEFHPYWIKVTDTCLYLKGRLGNTTIYIKANISEVFGRLSPIVKPLRARLNDSCSDLSTKAEQKILPLKAKASEAYDHAKTNVSSIASDTMKVAQAKTSAISDVMQSQVRDIPRSAVAGAAVLGTGGGATGFVAGGAVGAAMGVIPAVFTFGLSIPIGAAIGSGTGLCVGAAAGGATGFASGKIMGSAIEAHKADIDKSMSAALSTANACKDYVNGAVDNSTKFVKGKLNSATAKFCSSTGSNQGETSDELPSAATGGTLK